MQNSLATPHDSGILRQRIFLVIVASLLAIAAWPAFADDTSIASSYIRTSFTVDEGLPDNVVNAITETDNGLLWVGTASGLASFDGRTFTPVRLRIPGGLPPSSVSSLVEGANGDLWVGSDAGIIRIPKLDLNDPYLAGSTSFRLGEQQSDEIEVLFNARDGTIWAGTNHGLYRFDGTRFRCALSSEYVGRIRQAPEGELILNTGHGFAEYDGNRIIRHPGLGAQLGVSDDQIFDAYRDSEGTTWYCTTKGIRAVAVHRTLSLSLDPFPPAHTDAYRIFVDPNGALWVNTRMGIYRIADGHMLTPAPNLHARSFYAQKNGDLWIGTNGDGLLHLHPRTVQMYTKADGLPNDIAMAVLPAHDGRLWVGMNCGLAVLEGNHFRTFQDKKDGLANTCVWSLAEDRKHNIWIGTYGGGLLRYRNGVFTQYMLAQGTPSPIVFEITVAKDDSLWIATPNGVTHMEDRGIRNYTTADGLSSTRVLDIHQDNAGNIWVATQAGVDRFVSNRFVPVPATEAAREVLARRFVEDSRGNLYTTDMPQGVSQIRNGQLTLLDSRLSLMGMVESPDHTLWFSSRDGVIRIDEKELARTGSSSVPLSYEVFNRADGLNTTEASVGAPNIARTPDAKLWIATVKGLAMIDTSQLPLTGRKPKIFIAGVSKDGGNYVVGEELVLRPGIHRVEFKLAAIDLANPQKIRLQYRMEGVDSDWLEATSSRTVVYTNLPVGRHRLLVRATDSMGHWDSPQVAYEITQQPHFYEKPIFLLCVAVVALLLLVLLYMMRVRYLVKQARVVLEQRQAEREAVARDLHDTFLQGVQGLILRFHTGTQQLPPDHPVRQSFEEALQLSDQVMMEGRSVLSRLRTKKMKPETLTEAYAAIGKEFRSLSPAYFGVILSGRSRDLGTVVKEELQQTGREALFNAYRHARARRIEVEIHFGIFEFRVRFRDDGIGIDPEILREGSVAGHYGLPGMRERVARIGGHMELWSRPGAGTEIEIRIPGAIAYRQTKGNVSPHWIQRFLRSRAS